MRVLALDIGERRVGVAVSDTRGRVATPVGTFSADILRGDFREIVAMVAEHGVDLVLLGLPLSMDGTEGPQARNVRETGGRLARFLPIPIEYADERLSTTTAASAARAAGIDEREMRGTLDAAAAAVFLQGWLDGRGPQGEEHDDEAR